MKNKFIRFPAPEKFPKLPHLLYAGMDTVNRSSYCWDGKKRQSSRKCVFQYTIDGCGYLSSHGNTHKVDCGKAFIYDLSDPDNCYFFLPGETKTWSFVYCVFSNFEDQVKQLNARHGPVYNFGAKNFLVERLISLLDSQTNRNLMISSFKSYSFCAEIIGEMCRLIELREDRKNGSSLVMNARTLIHEKRLERFSLKGLSCCLGVCPEHLCREFKKHLNCSPKCYHDKLRAESICERLINNDESIKEIAGDFGFDDVSNFNKFFKKCYSMTPGQFRRNSMQPLHDMFND